MAKIGFELPWVMIDKDIEFFLNSTNEQKALAGVKASLPGGQGTGFLCVTQDYIMFARCSLLTPLAATKGELWAFERPTMRVSTHAISHECNLSIYYNQNGDSGFVEFVVDPWHQASAFVTYCNTGRRPTDPPPPKPAL